MNSIIPSPTQELRSDLHRTIGVLSQIAVSFDALSEPSGSSTVQILGSCQDSKASTVNSSSGVSESSEFEGFNIET